MTIGWPAYIRSQQAWNPVQKYTDQMTGSAVERPDLQQARGDTQNHENAWMEGRAAVSPESDDRIREGRVWRPASNLGGAVPRATGAGHHGR